MKTKFYLLALILVGVLTLTTEESFSQDKKGGKENMQDLLMSYNWHSVYPKSGYERVKVFNKTKCKTYMKDFKTNLTNGEFCTGSPTRYYLTDTLPDLFVEKALPREVKFPRRIFNEKKVGKKKNGKYIVYIDEWESNGKVVTSVTTFEIIEITKTKLVVLYIPTPGEIRIGSGGRVRTPETCKAIPKDKAFKIE